MKSICFATNNRNKTEEIEALLGPFFVLKNLEDIGCFEELAETQNTIEGNSLQKARHVFDRYHVSCFADDTGLEVEALSGEPGVFSARYAGDHKSNEDNIRLLLLKMKEVENRRARFKTVITLIDNNVVTIFEGIVQGIILTDKRGLSGFGYDPVFQPDGYMKSFAEMSLTEKNLISHRAIAVKKLINFLREKYT